MRADLDLLCISIYCTADDLLSERPRSAPRELTAASERAEKRRARLADTIE